MRRSSEMKGNENYEEAVMEIIWFEEEDVITTSNPALVEQWETEA